MADPGLDRSCLQLAHPVRNLVAARQQARGTALNPTGDAAPHQHIQVAADRHVSRPKIARRLSHLQPTLGSKLAHERAQTVLCIHHLKVPQAMFVRTPYALAWSGLAGTSASPPLPAAQTRAATRRRPQA